MCKSTAKPLDVSHRRDRGTGKSQNTTTKTQKQKPKKTHTQMKSKEKKSKNGFNCIVHNDRHTHTQFMWTHNGRDYNQFYP